MLTIFVGYNRPSVVGFVRVSKLLNNIDSAVLDSILWVIGSEVCAKLDYRKCLSNCAWRR